MPLDNPHDSPLMFTVTECPAYFGTANTSMYKAGGWKALVRRHPTTGTPAILHVVKDSYKVTQNRDLYKQIDDTVIAQAGVRAEGAIIKDEVSYLGAFGRRQYVFPNMKCEVEQGRGRDSTSVGFRVVVSNSFDGSSAIKMLAGAIDFYCSNGCIRGDFDQSIQRHTSTQEIVLPRMIDKLKASIDVFWRHADILRAWAKKEISDETAELVILKFGFSESRSKAILARFRYEAEIRGRTVWALYSALTYYATHNDDMFSIRSTGSDNVAATLQKRELEVFKITNSNEWRQLVAA